MESEDSNNGFQVDMETVTRSLVQQIADLSMKCAMQEGAIQKLSEQLSEAQKAIDIMSEELSKSSVEETPKKEKPRARN